MKNLIEFILIHLVDHPEDVKVEEEKSEHETSYMIHVHDDDIGRVIGKGGSVIQAIRQIARVRATKEGERVRIDIHTEDDRAPKTEMAQVSTEPADLETAAPEAELAETPEVEPVEVPESDTKPETATDSE